MNGSYNYFRSDGPPGQLQVDLRATPSAVNSAPTRNYSIITGLVGEITPTLLNTFRFGFVRNRFDRDVVRPSDAKADLALPGTSTSLGFVALDAASGTLSEPIDIGAQIARNQLNNSRNLQFVEDVTWLKGRHTMQFGANVRHLPYLNVKDDA